MPINAFLKCYIFNICLAIFTIFCSQEALCAEDSIFQRYARGGVTIKEYYDFQLQSITIAHVSEAILVIEEMRQTLDYETDKTPRNYPKLIEMAESRLKMIFDRLKLYYGMDALDYKDYKSAMKNYYGILEITAKLYLKIGEYYEAMGDLQSAKSTYRHVIVTYTDDIFKSSVKKAEFALKDCEKKQERLATRKKKLKQTK